MPYSRFTSRNSARTANSVSTAGAGSIAAAKARFAGSTSAESSSAFARPYTPGSSLRGAPLRLEIHQSSSPSQARRLKPP